MTLIEIKPLATLAASESAEGRATVVELRGEGDLSTLPVIVGALVRAISDHDGPVIVDLAGLTFVDTGAVRAFGRAWKFLDDRGRTLVLRSPSRLALRIITLLGISHLVEVALAPGLGIEPRLAHPK